MSFHIWSDQIVQSLSLKEIQIIIIISGRQSFTFPKMVWKIGADPQTFEIEFQADKVNQADPANPSLPLIRFRAQLIQPGNCSSHPRFQKSLSFEGHIAWDQHLLISCDIDQMQSLLFCDKGKCHIQICDFHQNWILYWTQQPKFSQPISNQVSIQLMRFMHQIRY